MNYYKIMKNGKVIDVLDELRYLKYHPKFKRMFNANGVEDAQAILSSDEKYIWHLDFLKEIPAKGYDTVDIVPIDVYEYNNLKMLNGHTFEEIVDSIMLSLLEGGII